MTTKHPYQQLRYDTVRQALREELACTKAQAEKALRRGGTLPDWPHALHSQRLWLAKDVLDFIERVKNGDTALLGKGEAGGGTSMPAAS